MDNKNPVAMPFICGMLTASLLMIVVTHLMISDMNNMIHNQNEDVDKAFQCFTLLQTDALKSKKDVDHKLDLLKLKLSSIETLLLLNLLAPKPEPPKPIVYNRSFMYLNGKEMLHVVVTAYTNSVEETYGDPNITASGNPVSPKYIACSRDIIERWGYGTKVALAIKTENGTYFKFGEYEIQDTMHEKYTNACDLFMWDKEEALQFGRRKMRLIKL